jgi:lactoylglutathione lyase
MIEKLYHITFPVLDIKKTVSFYENMLGLKKTGEWPNYAEFDVGGVHFGFEQKGKQEIFLLVKDVDEAYENLKKKGVKFVTEPKDMHWGARAATFVDPDGNEFTIEHFKK